MEIFYWYRRYVILMHVYMYTQYTYGTGIYHSLYYRRIRFDSRTTRMKAARAKSVFQALPTLPWYKLPSGAVASVCGS